VRSPARPNASLAEGSDKVVEIDGASEAKSKCEPLIDADEAAKLLEVHPKTVKRLAAEGIIPAMRIGRLWRFRASLLDAWMRSQLHLSRHPCTDTKGEE
jgi:excisionase family DNA binding protein